MSFTGTHTHSLPSGVIITIPSETYIEEYEGEKYSDSDTEQFTYEFNEDGTLHRAGETFFKYGTIAEQGDVDKYKAKVTRAEKSRKRGYMFGLRHKNRRK
mgnify:CR=1 FL=1